MDLLVLLTPMSIQSRCVLSGLNLVLYNELEYQSNNFIKVLGKYQAYMDVDRRYCLHGTIQCSKRRY